MTLKFACSGVEDFVHKVSLLILDVVVLRGLTSMVSNVDHNSGRIFLMRTVLVFTKRNNSIMVIEYNNNMSVP